MMSRLFKTARREKSERCISYLTSLFAEYCTEQSFLGSQLCFSLWSNLADKYITCMNLGTDSYDTVFIKVF